MRIKKINKYQGKIIHGGSLPDIDSEFDSQGKGWVKNYMSERFGREQVCSVGTYQTMALKGALKAIFRTYHNTSDDIKEIELVTSCLDDKEDKTITDLFIRSVKEKKVYNFIQKHPYVIYDLQYILKAPVSTGIHACAVMIFPKDRDMYRWTPIYKNKDGVILTVFEGGFLDQTGFLKQDILALKQLDKFKGVRDRLRKRGIEPPDLYNLPLDDKNVFEYLAKGWNGGVFQLGSDDLSKYTRKLKPTNIYDIIACIALYRPGAIQNKFHEAYIKRKNGEEPISYLWGTENILNETLGIVIYQESVAQICVNVAGFDLVSADSVRKAMGKKDITKLLPYKEKFIEGATNKGCPKDEADSMWSMLLEFASYAFNKSHSAEYGVMGYACQYEKVHHPTEFWASEITQSDDKDIPKYISEINQAGAIKINPPEINRSGIEIGESSDGNIYWALTSIKGIAGKDKKHPEGGSAVIQIRDDKVTKGKYTSFDNFLERSIFKGSKVNKTVIESLILSGAFDEIEGIKHPLERRVLLERHRTNHKVKINEKTDFIAKNKDNIDNEWLWQLKQKQLSGLAFFDYSKLILDNFGNFANILDEDFMNFEIIKPKEGCVGGVVLEAIERTTKYGDKYVKLKLEMNYVIFNAIIWSDTYEQLSFNVDDMKGNILLMDGKADYDARWGQCNQIQTTDKSKVFLLKLQ